MIVRGHFEQGAAAASHVQGVEDFNHGQSEECHGGSIRAVYEFPYTALDVMADQIRDHHQDGYDCALEEHVEAHAARKDSLLGISG